MRQFALQNDITKKVAERWKDVEQKDVDDLLRCYIKFLKQKTEDGKDYAFDIPYLGKLYKKVQNCKEKETELPIEMLKDILFNSENYELHPLYRTKTLYKIRTKNLDNIELMHTQNAIKED